MVQSDGEDGRFQSRSPDESDQEEGGEENDQNSMKNGNSKPQGGTNLTAKDPNRPRRKKARRACYACQRAHLTCGMYYQFHLCYSRELTTNR